eukprot:8393306-Pyramimonas_sp.AAC.1
MAAPAAAAAADAAPAPAAAAPARPLPMHRWVMPRHQLTSAISEETATVWAAPGERMAKVPEGVQQCPRPTPSCSCCCRYCLPAASSHFELQLE